ncbi:MAG: VCBS repeat-containing protein [Verrucomicrobiae bacterium]|nr:VCBS repeat-containing protein [Verrucomicrobiae bacterium]
MNKIKIAANPLLAGWCVLMVFLAHPPLPAAGANLPAFAATRLINTGSSFQSALTAGDFNHDGFADVAAVSLLSSNVVVLLADGHGAFQPAVNYGTSAYGFSSATLTSTDANRDGHLDLIASGLAGTWLLTGQGDGTFQPAVKLSSYGSVIAFGDFNGDNKMDYAYYKAPYVTIELGNGDGTYQAGANYMISLAAGAQAMIVGDLNHDGIEDLVLAGNGSPGLVSVLLGAGDGTFQPVVNTSVGTDNNALAVGDFNHDGRNDVAVTDYDAGAVILLWGNGDGSFASSLNYNVGAQPQSVVSGDFNHDGLDDLLVMAATNGVVLLGNGNGTFQTPQTYDWLEARVAVGDFNGDGQADLVTATGNDPASLGIVLGNGDGTFQAAPNYAVELNPNSIGLGDLNGDGRAELVVANANSNNISVLLNHGDGTFQPRADYLTGNNPQSVVVADFTGHGTNDVVVANLNSGVVSLLRGNGDGTLQPATTAALVTVGSSYVLADDFNNDHQTDLAVLGLFGVSVFKGNGDGTFQPAVTTAGPFELDQLATADFNHDGLNDLVFNNYGANTVSVMLGNGNGSFQTAVNYPAGTNLQSVAVGDFNGDGTNDLVAAGTGNGFPPSGTVAILLGRGDGTFGPPTNCLADGSYHAVAVGDFNGDGQADLAVAESTPGNQVHVLAGNGDGTFQPPVTFAAGNNPAFIAVGDVNGDGRPDLAVANAAANTVSVLLNTDVPVSPMIKMLPTHPGDESITFSWPVSAAGFSLETIANLGAHDWRPQAGILTTNGANVEATVPIGPGSRFFRLHKL